MARTTDVIRLVGGPPKLDGALYDLRLSEHDRADAADDQFVRATDGSTITALASLQAAVPRPSPGLRAGHAVARAALPAERASAAGSASTGSRVTTPSSPGATIVAGGPSVSAPASTGPGLPPPPARTTVWSALEQAVDEAAARFAEVAALVPAGPLADRASSTQAAVESCVADARRLCAVGATFAPEARHAGIDDQAAALLARITSLVHTIDLATSHLVALAPRGAGRGRSGRADRDARPRAGRRCTHRGTSSTATPSARS